MISTQHRDTQETLAVLDRLDLDTEKPSEEDLAKKFGYEEDYLKGTFFISCFNMEKIFSYNKNFTFERIALFAL